MLEPLGIGKAEEEVYKALLKTSSSSTQELERETSCSASQIRKAVNSLVAKGLISRAPGQSARFIASPPDVALEILVLERQEELERVRVDASRLKQVFSESRQRAQSVDVVEMIGGAGAIGLRVRQLRQAARRALMIFDNPPYLAHPDDALERHYQHVERLEGWACRSLFSDAALQIEGRVGSLQAGADPDEELRFCRRLPMKLIIADNHTAIVPLFGPEREKAVLIHASPLLDGLIALFEAYWEQGLPLSFYSKTANGIDASPQASDNEKQLLNLLVAGIKDDAIAKELGLDVRTVRRRVSNLLDVLSVKTRFQAGAQATRRGWI